jgi:hypothetical protein
MPTQRKPWLPTGAGAFESGIGVAGLGSAIFLHARPYFGFADRLV